MKKLWIFLFILTNVAFGKILEIDTGGGIRNINQEIDLYYIKESSLGVAEIKPTTIKFNRKSTSFIYGKIDIPLLPAIEVKYLEYVLRASLFNNLNFYFGNIQVANTPADITLDQDTKELDLDIYYSLPFLNFIKLGAGANFLDIKLRASAKFENGTSQEDIYNLSVPILYIFSSLNYEKSRFILNFKFKYLPKINVDDYNVEYLAVSPQIGYKILSLPAIKLITYTNYEYSRLKIIKEPTSSDRFYLDRKNNNFEIGGYLNIGF